MGYWDNASDEAVKESGKTGFAVIPNDTNALAIIENVCLKKWQDNPEYVSVEWVLIDGEFKNRHIWQSLRIDDEDEAKANRARNTLLKIYEIAGAKKPNDRPSNMELFPLIGKQAGIKILEYKINDKHDNFIGAVVPSAGFVCKTGQFRDFSQEKPFKNKSQEITAADKKETTPEFNDDIDIAF